MAAAALYPQAVHIPKFFMKIGGGPQTLPVALTSLRKESYSGLTPNWPSTNYQLTITQPSVNHQWTIMKTHNHQLAILETPTILVGKLWSLGHPTWLCPLEQGTPPHLHLRSPLADPENSRVHDEFLGRRVIPMDSHVPTVESVQ